MAIGQQPLPLWCGVLKKLPQKTVPNHSSFGRAEALDLAQQELLECLLAFAHGHPRMPRRSRFPHCLMGVESK